MCAAAKFYVADDELEADNGVVLGLPPEASPGAQIVNPAMITLAREARGLTQSELARRMSITQGKLSKMENGVLGVSEDTVESLAQELGYPVSFFWQPDSVYGMGASEMFHRKRQSVPNKTLDMVHAQINVMRMHVTRFLRGVDIGEWHFPVLDLDDFNGDVEEVASALRSHWLMPEGPVTNVVKAIEDAGGIVIPFDFKTQKIDAISHWPPGLPPLFFINVQSPGDRLRFTLAHEIGHIIMHSHFPHPEMERQADQFAGAFLLPRRRVRPQLVNLTLEKLATLKQVWKVSMRALVMRAAGLGLLTDWQERSLWIQLAPFKTREPAELDVPVEVPALLGEIIRAHRDDLGYTTEE